ncbi:hypothetical protein NBRC116585_21390 [Thalassolituus maritimus]|uniref:Uncharacterized protein n=1 Tax=Thalassolituus maritimus TaxID=484498 RepID=A0ABQ0A0V6_9GAMM
MIFKVSKANCRFNELSVGVGQTATSTSYRCDHCSVINTLTHSAFDKALFKDSSVFNQDLLELINAVRKFERGHWEEFLDFKCRGCNSPVRVIYEPNEFRMGCHYYQLKLVIEAASAKRTS